jgi:hypothetical protein
MVNQTYNAYANELEAYLEFEQGAWPKVANLLVSIGWPFKQHPAMRKLS